MKVCFALKQLVLALSLVASAPAFSANYGNAELGQADTASLLDGVKSTSFLQVAFGNWNTFNLNASTEAAGTGQISQDSAVNNLKSIAASGNDGREHEHTVVVSVPENDTSTLLISGLILLCFLVHRRALSRNRIS